MNTAEATNTDTNEMLLSRVLGSVRRLCVHPLARSASWLASGQVANRVLQAAYFLLVARLLGVIPYGMFAGVFALVNVVAPYSALGSAMLFMRYVSMDRSMARLHWGNTIATICVVSVFLCGALSWIGAILMGPSRVEMIVVLVIASCLMSQISTCASSVFLTLRRVKSSAAAVFLANSARFITVALMVLFLKHATAFQWSVGFLLSSTAVAMITLIWVRSVIGPMKFDIGHARKHFWEGIGFSVAGSTESIYNDFDKVMLSHYGMDQATGIYTMAYRVVDLSTTPLNALIAVAMPRLFVKSKEGIAVVTRTCAKLTRMAFAIGIGSACFTLVASPWVLRLVGNGFTDAVLAIRWLCWLPALRGIHQTAGSALTATGRQNYRTGAQATVGVANVALNFWLIPTHGWLGAAWASLASDGLLSVLNVALVLFQAGQLNAGAMAVPAVHEGGIS